MVITQVNNLQAAEYLGSVFISPHTDYYSMSTSLYLSGSPLRFWSVLFVEVS